MLDINNLLDKDCLPKSLLLFFTNLLEDEFNNIDALLELKEFAYTQYEDGKLTESQHCDVEALLDYRLSLL